MEAFYLEQGLMDQRAFAAAFDATFVQASPCCPAAPAISRGCCRFLAFLAVCVKVAGGRYLTVVPHMCLSAR